MIRFFRSKLSIAVPVALGGLALGGMLFAGPAAQAQPCTSTWDGGAGTNSWHDAANWDPNGLPGTTANVCIPNMTPDVTVTHSSFVLTQVATLQSAEAVALSAGTLQLEGASAMNAGFTQSGGTLSGAGVLTVTGSLSWTGGTQSGTGTTTIPALSTMTISGAVSKTLSERTLLNQGLVQWTAGDMFVYSGATWENTGTFELRSNDTMFACCVTPGIHNTGTIKKLVSTGVSEIDVQLDNDGTVEAATGTLRLDGGGNTSEETGSYLAPATLEFRGGTRQLGTTSSVSGAGTVLFSGGTVHVGNTYSPVTTEITGGTVNFNSTASTTTATQSGGTLGGAGTLTVSSSFSWTGGTQSGTGTTTMPALSTMTISGATSKTLSERTLLNQGLVQWTAGDLFVYSGATIENAGTFELRSNQTMFTCCVTRILNTGTIRKLVSTGVSEIDVPLDNDGTVEAVTGTLKLDGGGNVSEETGSYLAPATLEFGCCGTRQLGATSSVSGAGTVRFVAGTVNINGAFSPSTTEIQGGAVNFNSTASTTAATLSGGTLGGAGNLSATSSFSWTGGTQSGTGTTTIPALSNMTISGATSKTLSERTLLNEGLVQWTAGDLFVYSGATIDNAGTFELRSDQTMFTCCASDIHNTGTIRKLVSTGVSEIDVPLDNDGTVEAATGTLKLDGGGNATDETGSYLAPATLEFGCCGTRQLGPTSSVSGAGTVRFSGGTVNVGNTYSPSTTEISAGTVNLNSTASTTTATQSGGTLGGTGTFTATGTFSWTGGTQSGTGTTTMPALSTMTISGATSKTLSERTLLNQGLVQWTAGDLFVYSGATIENAGTFELRSNQTMFTCCASDILNTGSIRKLVSTGVSEIDVPLDNDGTVEAATGTLKLDGGGNTTDETGSYLAPATLEFGCCGTRQLGTTSSVSGAGTVRFSGGTIHVEGTYSPATTTISGGTVNFNSTASSTTATLSGGTLGGAGTFTATGTFSWTGGTKSGTGTTTIPALSTMTISGATSKTLSTRTLLNEGTVQWTGGDMSVGSGATWQNTGLFELRSNQTMSSFCCASPAILNSGTVRKLVSLGVSEIDVPLDNDGTVEAATGTLKLDGGGNTTDETGSYLAPATLEFGCCGTRQLGATSSVTGAGTVRFSGGTIHVEGTYSPSTTAISGGTANFNVSASSTTATLSAGTLGGTGTFTATGTFSWTGGTQSGTGTTTMPALSTMTISGALSKTLSVRTLLNQGTVQWTGGDMSVQSGATIENTGTFELRSNQTMSSCCAAVILNTGTIRKLVTTGVSEIDVPLDNDGTVEAATGTLKLDGGGNTTDETGSYLAPATLEFGCCGTRQLATTSTVSGAGTVRFSGGTINVDAAYSPSTTAISGGTANFNATASTTTATLSSGTLGGTGTLSITSTFSWTGGTQSGTGTTTIPALSTMTISGVAPKTLSVRTLNNQGLVQWTTGDFSVGSGATWQNAGTFEIRTNHAMSSFCCASPVIQNTGTITKLASTGTSVIDVRIENPGTFSITSGRLNAASLTTSGTVTIAAASTLSAPTFTQTAGTTTLSASTSRLIGPVSLQGGRLAGVGTVEGTLTNGGGTVAPGLSAGALTETGAYVQQTGGTYDVELGGIAPGTFDRIDVSALATLNGTLRVSTVSGFVPQAGQSWRVMTYGSRTGKFLTVDSSPVGGPLFFQVQYNATNATLVATVNPDAADMSITGTDSPDPVFEDNPVTYTLSVSNAGPSVATDATLTDTIPAGASFNSATSTRGTCSQAAGVVTCQLGAIGSGTGATVTIVATPPAPGTITNVAQVAANQFDPGGDNNSVSIQTQVLFNNPPVAADDTATTPEDTAVTVNVLQNDSDADNDPLSVSAVSDPACGGTLRNPNQTVTFTPDLDFNGLCAFTYTASDGKGGLGTATVSVTVTPVNDPPVARDDTASTPEDTAVTVTVLQNDTDVDLDSLAVSAVSDPPCGGTARNANQTVTFTPDVNFNGLCSFTYTASDGKGGNAMATVSVTVTPVNDPPVAVDDSVTTQEVTPVRIPVLQNDADVDLDTLAVTAVTDPPCGVAAINADRTVTYTPDRLDNETCKGSDAFTYTISDGNGGTDSASVFVTVIGCSDDGLDFLKGTPLEGIASGTIRERVEPAVRALDDDLGFRVHRINCDVVVPLENEVDDVVP